MRLEEIAEEYGDAVKVEWKSFLLRPEPEPRTMEKFTAYTESWERPGSVEPRAKFQRWSGDHEPPSHSVPSSVAGKVAETFGPEAFERFHTNLLEAYFSENRTVSDREVIHDIAAASEIDAAEFDRRWDEDEKGFTQAVFKDYMLAANSGITGVPAVVVNRTYLLPGAVDVDEYRLAIARVVEDAAAGD